MTLTSEDFPAFFREIHGVPPFPWQRRLARQVIEEGRWPGVLDLPTGSGKTAALDVALFHLAVDLDRGGGRSAPTRVAFVVDRRLVVDDAFARARKIEHALASAQHGVAARVAEVLRRYAGPGAQPLVARALRGGIPREDDWARTPTQPTILCSTVDQVGSRLLFRGYGVSDSMKPVHAGLLGADCLMLLDEAHVAEPFRQTLAWVEHYRSRSWRMVDDARPWGVALLTATPGVGVSESFALDEQDRSDPVLARRLRASKPARLVLCTPSKERRGAEDDEASAADDLHTRAHAHCAELAAAFEHFRNGDTGIVHPVVGVVVNRVARARAVFERVKSDHPDADVHLLIGPARSVDRDQLAQALSAIRTDADRALERAVIVVATQCIEVGVDLDLDGLITEVAPLDALRQRFGRLNRAGRDVVPFASVLAWKSEVSGRRDDPVYGSALKAAWALLETGATLQNRQKIVDFGIDSFSVAFDVDALSPKPNAPVLLPSHLDLLGQTSPIPSPDPDVGLFLHGAGCQPDAVTVVWRGDLLGVEPEAGVRRLLSLMPPRAGEAVSLPVWAVRRWLMRARDPSLGAMGDTVTRTTDGDGHRGTAGRRVFRWVGDDENSRWVVPSAIRPGDTVVVPARYGGADESGWNPEAQAPVVDVAARAARPYAGRRFAVRVAAGLVERSTGDRLLEALSTAESAGWRELRAALMELGLPREIYQDLEDLDRARKNRVVAYLDVYAPDAAGHPTGVVFVAPLGLSEAVLGEGGAHTEDDIVASLTGVPIPLEEHCREVAEMARAFACSMGLPQERQRDLEVAALLHDLGKADPRFQAWLHYDDPLGLDPSEAATVLAKSGRELPRAARGAAALPDHWRHEALSVRLAPLTGEFARAADPDLVLWLIGTHHGRGRVWFPHEDPTDGEHRMLPPVFGLPTEIPPGPGPQSLAFSWHGADWAALYEQVRARYGVWDLALLEAALRLADHRTSEKESGGAT